MLKLLFVTFTGLAVFRSTARAAQDAPPVPVSADFTSPSLAVGLMPDRPAFAWFDVDSLGKGRLTGNVVMHRLLPPADHAMRLETLGKGRYAYRPADGGDATWEVTLAEGTITLISHHAEATSPFTLVIDQKVNHATLLATLTDAYCVVQTPAVLHLPDRGTFAVTSSDPKSTLSYTTKRNGDDHVAVAFPPATAEQGEVSYTLHVTLIYRVLPGVADDARYDGYRRNFLNLIQLNPRLATLANNSSSDVCGFCLYEYAELGRVAPPLADGLTVLGLVKTSVQRLIDGKLSYGQVGYAPMPEQAEIAAWSPPFDSLDSRPSWLISASYVILDGGETEWGRTNWSKLCTWADEMTASDSDGNGLIEYPLSGNRGHLKGLGRTVRPANWWDTIGFGHEDAYSNALAYRAYRLMAEVATKLDHPADAERFARRADLILKNYVPTLLNPKSGLIAGWHSADGDLHDYAFTFVNGMAVAVGLVPDKAQANAIMDRMMVKFKAVGYDRFDLGLPGNLLPVRQEDYLEENPRFGWPSKADGSDGFQIYENGGATACHTYWLVKALYGLGRVEDARRIYHPMLKSYAEGGFQGTCPGTGMSVDWRDWNGGCHGYEGFLVDNYLALLAVEDDLNARD